MAYLIMVVAAIIILRIVVGTVIGFVHMVIFVALFVFAVYAFLWARRFKRG